MTDPRVTPDRDKISEDTPAQISEPVVDLLRSPGGSRDRQLLLGDGVTVLSRENETVLIRADKDGYCGWIDKAAWDTPRPITHKVTARATHAYQKPDIKSANLAGLSFGSQLSAIAETATFIETPIGFVPRQHVHPVEVRATDPAAIAAVFLGSPYLWGGNSHLGIDCSGLVQAACVACGIPCPGDSDQQAKTLGTPLPATSQLARNDLIFWKGHVALVTDDSTLIHANAGHMSVVYEGIEEALTRIETQGDGRPTGYRRLPVPHSS